MSELKATPGPWEICNAGDIFGPLGGNSGDGLHADADDGWQVAEIGHYLTFVDGELVELGEEVRKANAHLIAAAPELYDLVHRILEEGMSREWQGAALLALAKARGES